MSLLLKITQKYGKCSPEQQLCLLQCVSEQTVPYEEGRAAMAEGAKRAAILPSFFDGGTIGAVKKIFQG